MAKTNNHGDDKNQAQLVREWLWDHYDGELHHSDELPGIRSIEEENGQVTIHLEEELQLDSFVEAIHECKPEYSDQAEELTVETIKSNGGYDAVDVYEARDLGNGSLGQFKAGMTYYSTDEIVLSGTGEPMWSDGNPAGDVVKHTLHHLIIYLNQI